MYDNIIYNMVYIICNLYNMYICIIYVIKGGLWKISQFVLLHALRSLYNFAPSSNIGIESENVRF